MTLLTASAYSPTDAGRDVATGSDPNTLLLFLSATGCGLAVVAMIGLMVILRHRAASRADTGTDLD